MLNYNWTPDRIEQLKALHREGKSYTEIANILGCGTRSVVGGKVMRLRDTGEIDGPRKFKISGERTRWGHERQCPGLAFVPVIKARLSEGRNDREIADECGIKPDDVRYVRRIKGLAATRRPPNVAPVFAAQLKELAEKGRSDQEIAKALGISYHQARYERRRQDIKSAVVSRPPVTTIVKGDPGPKIMAVFAEGFMGQRSRVSLLRLESGMCRFPIDQPNGDVRYCGDHCDDGQVYCAHHAARCYTASVPKTPLRPSHVYTSRR